MSQFLDAQAKENGTKFLIYPQNKKLKGFEQPELIYINLPPGSIQAGPEDEKMYVVDAKNKQEYRFVGEGPPYQGLRFPPVQSNEEGHFDHIRPDTQAFSSTVMYATVRRVLDIWEDYFGHSIQWYFHKDFDKLELIPRVEWDNAHSGYGFLEFGFGRNSDRSIDHSNPYCENFDVLAHEMGHTIKNSTIGWPENKKDETREYRGHHESFGDLVAIVSVMHFDSVINHILKNTKGNLFSVNELSRMGELSQSREIRMAFNNKKISDVDSPSEEHMLSEPFTGGAFDILVEVFQHNLIERGFVSKELGKRAYHAKGTELEAVQNEFNQCYQGKEADFKEALLDARDYFGKLMAKAWSNTSCNNLSYGKVLNNIIEADRELNEGKYKQTILDCFDWREIVPAVDDSRMLLNTHIVDELVAFSAAGEMGPEDFLNTKYL
ncbi:hypothetical protein AB3N02_27010 [Priestia aryabhattai]|uniref:hypothetical protein n=1 Tax=Priestia aryabhattai TaxID=412384 RepID=UPI0039A33062